MKARVKVDAGVCGFKTLITAVTDDGMNVDLKIGSDCDTIKELASQFQGKTPINAYQSISPEKESDILTISRTALRKKGCCEACAVPPAVCKAVYVAAGLALPKNVSMEITTVQE